MALTAASGTSMIQEVARQGQSLWLDNLRRQLISSGELARLRDAGITGATSNLTILEKAISGSTDYDEALARLFKAGRHADRILWELIIEDIQAAADIFRPIYEATAGADGFASIEVGPTIAHDTQHIVAMAQELHRRCERPNVMVTIPATRAGLPAIRHMIGEGKHTNVKFAFSAERYAEVVEAYLSGLEDFQKKGGDLSEVASVASFFVSRVDTKVDKLLATRIEATSSPRKKRELAELYGKAGIANSKMAYQRYQALFSGPRWEALEHAGARAQRCLWASTSVKDPRYRDTMYIEELIGPHTVATVTNANLAVFQEHGRVRPSLEEQVEESRSQLERLEKLGIEFDQVTRELGVEGLEAFATSYDTLLKVIRVAAQKVRAGTESRPRHSLGWLAPVVEHAVAQLQHNEVPRRLWAKDATLWSSDSGKREVIRNRLGWLNIAEQMLERRDALRQLAAEGQTYADVVLLGQGGTSVCADVLRQAFGHRHGYPRLHVLDTTDPAAVLDTRSQLNLKESLFVVASKSGTTIGTLSQFAYFWDEVSQAVPNEAGRHFAAVTDPGTAIERVAHEHDFRWLFQAPPDIGGRYSALTYFGLVPGALMGMDVVELLERAVEMMHACDASVSVEHNPGAWLGTVLGQLAAQGRNKVTLVLSPKIAMFGVWIEQLLAASTGKQGEGLIPIEGEPLGPPSAYGHDRVFVHVRLTHDRIPGELHALEQAGQPLVTLTLRDALDLGGEFLRFEIAAAIVGSMLSINVFGEPSIEESKDNTGHLLATLKGGGRLPESNAIPAAQGAPALIELLGQAEPGGYVALMAYTARTPASERAVARIRSAIRDGSRLRLATTAGYAPGFLHSTGRVPTGTPHNGLFVQIIQDDTHDAPIPGQTYGFSVLTQAQALGDLQSLRSRGLPVVRISLGRTVAAGWKALAQVAEAAVR